MRNQNIDMGWQFNYGIPGGFPDPRVVDMLPHGGEAGHVAELRVEAVGPVVGGTDGPDLFQFLDQSHGASFLVFAFSADFPGGKPGFHVHYKQRPEASQGFFVKKLLLPPGLCATMGWKNRGKNTRRSLGGYS